jgi:hypothetical protein
MYSCVDADGGIARRFVTALEAEWALGGLALVPGFWQLVSERMTELRFGR